MISYIHTPTHTYEIISYIYDDTHTYTHPPTLPPTSNDFIPTYKTITHTHTHNSIVYIHTAANHTTFLAKTARRVSCRAYVYYSTLPISKGGLPLSTSKDFFWISLFSPLDTDNFTARDPWIWRWREATSVIPYALESEHTALMSFFEQGLRAGQLGVEAQYQVVLQCTAVCCSVLQCVAVCRRGRAAVSSCVLQCTAVCCSVLQCVAVCRRC